MSAMWFEVISKRFQYRFFPAANNHDTFGAIRAVSYQNDGLTKTENYETDLIRYPALASSLPALFSGRAKASNQRVNRAMS
ncbi:hypothetical protein AB1N83_004304 [Pleurotus pulmonarius]